MRAATSHEVEHDVRVVRENPARTESIECRPMRDFSWGALVAELEGRGERVVVIRGVRRPRAVYMTGSVTLKRH